MRQSLALLVLNVGNENGLLGVAGMIKLLVMTGIIPENSLRLAPVSYWLGNILKLYLGTI